MLLRECLDNSFEASLLHSMRLQIKVVGQPYTHKKPYRLYEQPLSCSTVFSSCKPGTQRARVSQAVILLICHNIWSLCKLSFWSHIDCCFLKAKRSLKTMPTVCILGEEVLKLLC